MVPRAMRVPSSPPESRPEAMMQMTRMRRANLGVLTSGFFSSSFFSGATRTKEARKNMPTVSPSASHTAMKKFSPLGGELT